MNVLYFLMALLIFCSKSLGAIETVVVGHAANFSDVSTSSINPYNKAVSNGLEVAVDEYRERLKAKGLEIKIQNFDYGNKEILALGASRDVVASKAIAVIGFYESGQALLAAPELEKAGVPFISPVASATRLFGIGRHVHHMSFSNQDMGYALAHLSTEILKAKSALVVNAADCAYCVDLANAFEAKAKNLRMVVTKVEILNEDSKFDKVDQAIAGKKYDVVIVPNHELTSAKIIAHLMKMGIHAPFLGGDGWGNADGAGFFQIVSDPKFVGYCVGHWHPNFSNRISEAFEKRWQTKFGQPPTTDSVMAYDSMRFVITALLKSKSSSRLDLQNAIEAMPKFEGATGKFLYSSPGSSPRKPIVLLKSDMKTKKFMSLRTFKPKG